MVLDCLDGMSLEAGWSCGPVEKGQKPALGPTKGKRERHDVQCHVADRENMQTGAEGAPIPTGSNERPGVRIIHQSQDSGLPGEMMENDGVVKAEAAASPHAHELCFCESPSQPVTALVAQLVTSGRGRGRWSRLSNMAGRENKTQSGSDPVKVVTSSCWAPATLQSAPVGLDPCCVRRGSPCRFPRERHRSISKFYISKKFYLSESRNIERLLLRDGHTQSAACKPEGSWWCSPGPNPKA